MKSLYPLGLSALLTLSSGATPLTLEEIAHHSTNNMIVIRTGKNTRIEYTLPPHLSHLMNVRMRNIDQDPYVNYALYLAKAEEVLASVLPQELIDIIHRMRNENEPACILIRNMPIDDHIPPTPEHGNRPCPSTKGYVSETTLLGICSLLGAVPDFDEREKDGTYINQIIPVDDERSIYSASSAGSSIPFYLHTENVYQEPPLRFFALLCLRGDPKVATSIIFLDHILEHIRQNPPSFMRFEQFMEEIQKPQFLMQSGPSFGEAKVSVRNPILMRNARGERVFRFNANDDRVAPTNEISRQIIEYMTVLLRSEKFNKEVGTKFFLSKGDMLLFNNWEVMHGRDAFMIDRSNWRWLQRVYMLIPE